MSRYTFFSAVHVIFEHDGMILLHRRSNTGFCDGLFDIPSGHIEQGETPRIAAVREVLEEIGVEITINDLEFVHVASRMGIDRERIDFYFKASRWTGTPFNAEPDKCTEIRWFANDALPEDMVPHVRETLTIISQGMGAYSEQNWPPHFLDL